MYDLQRRVKEEFDISLTYMDTRFLVLDLGINLVEAVVEEPKIEEKPAPKPTGMVSVTMDTLALPGALVSGKVEYGSSSLHNAPHTVDLIYGEAWDRPYSREQAAFPDRHTRAAKFWPAVGRVDNVYGDRNLVCSCVGMASYSHTA